VDPFSKKLDLSLSLSLSLSQLHSFANPCSFFFETPILGGKDYFHNCKLRKIPGFVIFWLMLEKKKKKVPRIRDRREETRNEGRNKVSFVG
jgi:hypothetical protein